MNAMGLFVVVLV